MLGWVGRAASASYAVAVADTSQSSSEGDVRAQGEDSERSQRESSVLTFLIADVRGYTRFTQEHGDEEAGRLAAAFACLAREAILSCSGEVIELRGDEALCVFGSARQALRAAVELQLSFRRQTDDGPAFRLPIGIGLDAGEAVPIEGGYRGGALNTAARLCSMAGPGQILATETVVSLARRLEGIRFVDRRPVRLKGLEKAVRVIEVVPEQGLPPLPAVTLKRPWLTKRRLTLAVVAALALAAAIVAFALTRSAGPGARSNLKANSVGEINAKTGAIAGQLPLSGAPRAVTAGGGYVWVASSEGTVSRVDPELRTTQTLNVGGSTGGIAYGAGSLWVTNLEARALVQINPKTFKPVQTIEVGNAPGALAVGKDAVWVVNTIDGTVSRVGLSEGSVTETIPVGLSPAGVATGSDAVWVTSEGTNTVVRLDLTSHAIVQAVNVGNDPTGVSVGEGAVWIANAQDGTVSRIDPTTNSVTATVPTGANPSAVAAGAGAIWVANSGDGTIRRLDPRTSRVTTTVRVGSSPNALALSDGKVWATTLSSPAGHRGGVLRVESPALSPKSCRCIDPAFWADESNPTADIVPRLVYDGLVTYRHVGGVAGERLVPDLAVHLPTPTDEGRTYSFQLRPGPHYSDGTPVRASDFRSSLERLVMLQPYAGAYVEGIVGARRCATRRGGRCDLSKGIETNDRAGTITIHLTAADPEFLYKLAIPLASVVPAGTLRRPARVRPIPATGPYRIASFDPSHEVRLVRNKYFRVWSADARPDGYPDEIRFHLSDSATASLAAVEKGKADWVSILPVGPARQRGALTRYADRIHNDPAPTTYWDFLNTRVPPFDDVRVRRALNFAIDRSKAVERGLTGRATCQILPPIFPGYRPYCPYTRNPNPAGTWTAPDLAKARALIAASRTAGMRVEVVTHNEANPLRASRYLVSLLDELGYRSKLRVFRKFPADLEYAADSRNRAQIGVAGWFADTLAASNFFQPLFTCASFMPKSPANLNLFEYCNAKLDAEMKHAVALEVSDPERANELWTAVDRAVVDQAVALPVTNGLNPVLLSERVGNYQSHPLWGTLLDQLWVK
jgi:YVTN family beta-propeller protein